LGEHGKAGRSLVFGYFAGRQPLVAAGDGSDLALGVSGWRRFLAPMREMRGAGCRRDEACRRGSFGKFRLQGWLRWAGRIKEKEKLREVWPCICPSKEKNTDVSERSLREVQAFGPDDG